MEETETAKAIRREEGNLRYEYFISMADLKALPLIDSGRISRHRTLTMLRK